MLSSPGYQRSNRWRMFRLIALSLLAIGLLVAVIVALLPAPSKVHFVVWVVAEEYAFPLPPNSWAREDAARFGELTGILSVSDRSAPPGRVETSDDWSSAAAVANRLAEPLKRDRGRRRPAILYLSAHSAVRPGPRGPEACLIPPGLDDAKLLDDKHWLSAAELAKALAAHDALRNRVTVLVLDSGKLAPSWPLGIFEQSFPGALAANLEDLPRPEGGALWVLCSQDDQQVAWTSPALRGSAFGHYLAHGLSGAADAEGNDDLSVSAGELATYLKRHVDAWAQANRAARQSPRWITPGASPEELDATELVDVGGSPPILDSPPGGAAPDAHEELDAQWQAAQEIGSAAACFAPVA